MAIKANPAGIDYAKELIQKNEYVKDSDWGEAQPSRERENNFIDRNGYEEFGKWHLAIDTEVGEGTKSRYKFPYGDLQKVHRSGVIAAKQRAAEWDHTDVLEAADSLLGCLPDSN
ncbi:hypothetical protein C7271_11840 [filamentous cyanobacterium CCP5]|nr:hypothetical protein C7271_11840 [filamentous cyanobacterium CCP5]